MDGMGGELRTVATAVGREIEVLTAGNPGGYPWLWVPGSPSAAVDYPRLDELATKLDLRFVVAARLRRLHAATASSCGATHRR